MTWDFGTIGGPCSLKDKVRICWQAKPYNVVLHVATLLDLFEDVIKRPLG